MNFTPKNSTWPRFYREKPNCFGKKRIFREESWILLLKILLGLGFIVKNLIVMVKSLLFKEYGKTPK